MLPFFSYISWNLLGECELLAKWMIGSLLYLLSWIIKKKLKIWCHLESPHQLLSYYMLGFNFSIQIGVMFQHQWHKQFQSGEDHHGEGQHRQHVESREHDQCQTEAELRERPASHGSSEYDVPRSAPDGHDVHLRYGLHGRTVRSRLPRGLRGTLPAHVSRRPSAHRWPSRRRRWWWCCGNYNSLD